MIKKQSSQKIAASKPIRHFGVQRGFSIVELMVALALGVILVGGITQVYIENKRNYVIDEAAARLQENGRFAINLLKREVKMAGFMGVGTVISDVTVDTTVSGEVLENSCTDNANFALDMANGIDFVSDATTGTAPVTVRGDTFQTACIPPARIYSNAGQNIQNDVLIVRRVADRATIEDGVWAPGLTAADEKPERWYLHVILDDEQAGTSFGEYFDYIDNAGFSATIEGGNDYHMWLAHSKFYYVRDWSIDIGDGIPTLALVELEDNQFVERALIEGIELFHIEWGIPLADSGDGTPREFVAAPTAAQLDIATVARIYMLVRSRDQVNGYTDTKTYEVGSLPTIGPFNDGHMRRVFTTTINIRNRTWTDI